MKNYYLVYKITNTLNNCIYIGVHATNKLEDGYMGSGTLIRKAIKESRKENFKKEILFFCNSKEEMFAKEKEIVNLEFIKREDTYNKVLGGSECTTLGMSHSQETKRKMSERWKSRVISEETKRKMSESKKGISFTKEHKEKIGLSNSTRVISDETRKKMSESRKKRITTEETRNKMRENIKNRVITDEIRQKLSIANKGKTLTEETKRKISESKTDKKPKPRQEGWSMSEEARKKISEKNKINWSKRKQEKAEYMGTVNI